MWDLKESPSRIEKRFEFDNYQKISLFMSKIEELCKSQNLYPNISFGKNFVSITLFIESKEISNLENDFSKNIDNIFKQV